MLFLNWKLWYQNLASNEQGNKNIEAFTDSLSSDDTLVQKVRTLTEDLDTVFLAASPERLINIFHSPKNLGGTRVRPTDKIVCLLGLGASATGVLLNQATALVDANIVVPTVDDLSNCETSEDVEGLAMPPEDGVVGFAGSGIIIPAPCIRDAILNANTLKPAELIPIIMAAARSFDEEHIDDEEHTQLALRNADDVAAWLWSVSTGRIAETRYSVHPDDIELNTFVQSPTCKLHCEYTNCGSSRRSSRSRRNGNWCLSTTGCQHCNSERGANSCKSDAT